MDECPQCGTESVWYVRDADSDADREDNVEIWRCENGHEFWYVPPGNGHSKRKWW